MGAFQEGERDLPTKLGKSGRPMLAQGRVVEDLIQSGTTTEEGVIQVEATTEGNLNHINTIQTPAQLIQISTTTGEELPLVLLDETTETNLWISINRTTAEEEVRVIVTQKEEDQPTLVQTTAEGQAIHINAAQTEEDLQTPIKTTEEEVVHIVATQTKKMLWNLISTPTAE